MKKIIHPLIILTLIQFSIKSQQPENFNVNNINTGIYNNISPFWNTADGMSLYQVGSDTSNRPICVSGFFLAGKDTNDSLYFSGQRFSHDEADNFTFGPIGNNYNHNGYQNYDRTWKVTSQEIWAHQQGLGSSNSILNWPAHGDVSNGEAFYLAPFIDVNGDGLYNPLQGDYPKIKGDQAVFFILKDLDTPHLKFDGTPLGVEIHIMIYGYLSSSQIIDNTTFINYSIYNRSSVDYSGFYLSSFMDGDLNCSDDDLTGSDSTRNVVYTYDDGDSTTGGGYCYRHSGTLNSAVGIKVLNHEMTSSYRYMYDNLYLAPHFYNIMKGHKKDGSIKINDITSNPTKFISPNGIQELNSDSIFNISDSRIYNSVGPYSFPSNSSICLDLAYVYNYSNTVSRQQNATNFLLATDTVQDFYDNVNLSCIGFLTDIEKSENRRITTSSYPNPAVDQATIDFSRELIDAEVNLQNSLGQIVRKVEISNVSHLQVERKELESGVYFYSILEKGNIIGSGKIVFE